jgi:hypothetical protein
VMAGVFSRRAVTKDRNALKSVGAPLRRWMAPVPSARLGTFDGGGACSMLATFTLS